jgi:RimJ/RimL family protein N-acetyltransferase
MFGIKMLVKHNGLNVLMRPLAKNDLDELVRHFSSMKVHLYTMGLFGQTYENELEWYEKNRKDDEGCIWGIQPEGHDKPIGVTGLHHIRSLGGDCTSGIIIWDANWWGKGVATATHLGRTLFAADYLNRHVIKSTARADNVGSNMALKRVGYSVWGTEPLDGYRQGRWLNSNHLIWIHPKMTGVLFPEGLPELFAPGVKRAEIALVTARNEVEFV